MAISNNFRLSHPLSLSPPSLFSGLLLWGFLWFSLAHFLSRLLFRLALLWRRFWCLIFLFPMDWHFTLVFIPKSLWITEYRPPKELKTKRYHKKRLTKIEDYKKKFKKLIRVKQQRKVWEKMEQDGEVARKWYKIEREVPVQGKEKKKAPKTPPKKRKAKKQSNKKVSKKPKSRRERK